MNAFILLDFKKQFAIAMRMLVVALIFMYMYSARAQSETPGDMQLSFEKSVAFPSPTAASLGKFGFIPVNYSTGTVQLSIPLWQFTEGSLSLPITLRCNNNGLRLSEEASWVGLGWALNTGGVITRIIRGISDIEGSPYSSDPNAKRYDQLGNPAYIDKYIANRIAEEQYDGEPDIFVYNFGNYSGKFMLYQDKVVPLPYNNLKIVRTGNDFEITTDKGVVYTFAMREITTVTSSYRRFNMPSHISSWFLTSIRSANGNDVIELVYDATERIMSQHDRALQYTFYGNHPPYDEEKDCGNDRRVHVTANARITIEARRLTAIRSRTTEIQFIPQETDRLDIYGNTRALKEIRVLVPGSDVPVKSIRFTYDYFGDAANRNVARLKLMKLQEFGKTGTSIEPYLFDYHESVFPDKYGPAMDHWGYVNSNNDPSLIPHIYDWQNFGNADREPNMSAAISGMLKKIIYPTKGFTNFSYAQNQYWDHRESRLRGGPGLRVSETRDYDGKQYRTVRYQYENPVFLGEPNYVRLSTGYMCRILGPTWVVWFECDYVTITGQNTSLFPGLLGNAMAYTNVTERIGNNDDAGSTLYGYRTSDNYAIDHEMLPTQVILRNAAGTTVRKTINTYKTVHDTVFNAFTPMVMTTKTTCDPSAERDPVFGNILHDYNLDVMYQVRSSWYSLEQVEETDYDLAGNSTVTNVRRYRYNSSPRHRSPTHIEYTRSAGVNDIHFFKYPQDYATEGAYGTDDFYNGLKAANELHLTSLIVENQVMQQRNGSWMVKNASLFLYKSFGNRQNVQLAEIHGLNTKSLLPHASSYTQGSQLHRTHLPYSYEVKYEFNGDGFLTSKTTRAMTTSFLWDHNTKLPIAKAENISYATLNSTYQTVGGDLSLLRTHTNLRGALLTTYQYEPLVGTTTMTDANGRSHYYRYDNLRRLKSVLDHDANIREAFDYNYKVSVE